VKTPLSTSPSDGLFSLVCGHAQTTSARGCGGRQPWGRFAPDLGAFDLGSLGSLDSTRGFGNGSARNIKYGLSLWRLGPLHLRVPQPTRFGRWSFKTQSPGHAYGARALPGGARQAGLCDTLAALRYAKIASGTYCVNRVGDQDCNANRDEDDQQPNDHVRLHPGVERAQPRTVKNYLPKTLILRWAEDSMQLLRPLSAL
jgi:hypothetical protein